MKPYNPDKLPLSKLNWTSFLRWIGPANAALARYDGMLSSVLNPRILLSPLTTQEAVLSSQIEGTMATVEEVLAFEGAGQTPAEESKRSDIQEILNYRKAMNYAIDELKGKPIHLNLIHQIHSVLLDSVRGKDKARGVFRRVQNWIGRSGTSMETARYIPPEPEKVLEYMSDLEKYIHFEEQDRLVQLAIIHAQFEMIHPYVDGNGRVGRILIPLFLYEKDFLSSPMFYLSAYLETHRDEYCSRLQAISQDGDWTGWIVFFLKAILEQAKSNVEKVRAILDLYEVKKKRIAEVTRSQYAIQTLDTLFKMPSFSTSRFVEESKIPVRSAKRILHTLEKEKIIENLKQGKGRSPAYFIFKKLIDIIR